MEVKMRKYVLSILICLTLTSICPADAILGWGGQRIDSRELLLSNFTAIAAGEWHSLALKSDGSIVGWGSNYYGQASPPDGNDFVAIAAGWQHSLALKSDGSIVGWGLNNYGPAISTAG